MKKIPEVKVSQKREINFSIWLVPFVALLVSLWLAYQYFSQLGPEIKIVFASSGGLNPKQSQIKFRDVPIGTVKKIELMSGDDGVIITARMNKDAAPYLNENSKFWIVKPEIGAKGISGLDTLVSGSYIQMYSQKVGKKKSFFKGLEEALDDVNDDKGRIYMLSAESSYDLEKGANVYCRQMVAGEIRDVFLSKDGERVYFKIFVKEEFAKFIHSKTKFWNASNISFVMSGAGIDVKMASISQIVKGGIAFNSSLPQHGKEKLSCEYLFPLFSSQGSAEQKSIGFTHKIMNTYQMHFSESIGNLNIGAPIEFFGFKVGEVKDIITSFDSNTRKLNSTIIASIDHSAFLDNSMVNTKLHENINNAINHGLKATLVETNPILKTLYIDLVYDENSTDNKIVKARPYDIFPTMKSHSSDMSAKVLEILEKVDKLPLEELLDSINIMVKESNKPLQNIMKKLDKSIANFNKFSRQKSFMSMPKEIEKTLIELQETLDVMQGVAGDFSGNSKFSNQLSTTLKEVTKASRAMQGLVNKLEHKPNAMIFGDE
jgi:paraquat-inducible protein B